MGEVIQAVNAAAAVALTEIDGYLIDEHGEIIAYRDVRADSQEFHVTNADGAAWVLERMMECEAALAGIAAKQRAILDNIAAERRTHEQRLKFFMMRYAAELEVWARENLPRGKKTWTCAYGSISFRKLAAGVEVTDEERAIEWCRAAGLVEGIKIKESLLVSVVKDALLADPPPPGHGVEVRGERETCKIKTGVKS